MLTTHNTQHFQLLLRVGIVVCRSFLLCATCSYSVEECCAERQPVAECRMVQAFSGDAPGLLFCCGHARNARRQRGPTCLDVFSAADRVFCCLIGSCDSSYTPGNEDVEEPTASDTSAIKHGTSLYTIYRPAGKSFKRVLCPVLLLLKYVLFYWLYTISGFSFSLTIDPYGSHV